MQVNRMRIACSLDAVLNESSSEKLQVHCKESHTNRHIPPGSVFPITSQPHACTLFLSPTHTHTSPHVRTECRRVKALRYARDRALNCRRTTNAFSLAFPLSRSPSLPTRSSLVAWVLAFGSSPAHSSRLQPHHLCPPFLAPPRPSRPLSRPRGLRLRSHLTPAFPLPFFAWGAFPQAQYPPPLFLSHTLCAPTLLCPSPTLCSLRRPPPLPLFSAPAAEAGSQRPRKGRATKRRRTT